MIFSFFTVTVHVVLTFVDIFPLIVIFVVPPVIPVTVPSSDTVATLGVSDIYVNSSTSPLGVVVTWIFAVSFFPTVTSLAIISVTFCIIITLHFASYSVPSTFAVIVASPLVPVAVIVPFATVATFVLELSHVIVPLTPSVNVAVIVSVCPFNNFTSFLDNPIPEIVSIV